MSAITGGADRGPIISASIVLGSLAVLATTAATTLPVLEVSAVVSFVAVATVAYRLLLKWTSLLALMILVILFIPIKRYTMPGNLPFELEPYRLCVALIAALWAAALLTDRRVRLRLSGFELPLAAVAVTAVGSVLANNSRITTLNVDSEVVKKLTFLFSFFVVFYLIVSVVRTLPQARFLLRVLVGGGGIVAFFAMIEARSGYNVFNQLAGVVPLLRVGDLSDIPTRGGRLRVLASSQSAISLGAAFAMLIPVAAVLARRAARWWVAVALLALGALATVSRTSVVMMIVVGIVFFCLRPRETKRLWPAVIPLVVATNLFLPGTLGTLKQSFFPEGGLIAEQSRNAGWRGSGRIADLDPALGEWSQQPLLGQGYGTRLTGREQSNAPILDNQWLKTLLETGLLGALAWLWVYVRFVRRLGRAAKEDDGERGWLLAALTASVTAFAVGMFLYDAFSFIQVTFLLFILCALGAALLRSQAEPEPA